MEMKKLLFLSIIAMFFSNVFATNLKFESQEGDEYIYFQIVEVSNNQMVIDVFKSSAVDDFCNFLGRKDIATSVGLWCVFMPGNPVCTAYGVAMAACTVYNAVRLYIEGDFSNAILETVSASTKIYKMSKVDSKNYKIE